MNFNFNRCLKFVLDHEGGWADHPRDPGGATMKGVTLAVFRKHLGREATKEELRDISDAQVFDIYRLRYWNRIRADDLPSGVDLSVFDMAVNAGVRRASIILQDCVGAEPDGLIGPKTLAAVNAANRKNLIVRFAEERREFYRGLKTFDTFGRGWLRRTDECEHQSLQMAGGQS